MLENLGSNVKIICDRIAKLLSKKDRIVVAIDGNCGSGKSTLGRRIANIFNANLFCMDDFFLTTELRTVSRMNEVGGNVDYVRFKNEIIKGINNRKPFQFRPYDCKIQSFSSPINVTPKSVNIIEGSYSLHPTLIEFYDLKIFLEISQKLQQKRILARNGPDVLERFQNQWIPLENLYFKTFLIKEKCDIVCCLNAQLS